MSAETIKWITNNSAFCVAPTSRSDFRMVHSKFKVTTCCNLDTSLSDKELDFNFVENVKTSMALGKLPESCWRCDVEEKNQAQSERVKLMLYYSVDELEQFKQINKTNEFQFGMKFSNLCNLACRSCNSDDSNLWAKLMNVTTNPEVGNDISLNELYWNAITNMIRVKHKENKRFIVHPIGGETMVQPGFLKLINWLIDENLSSTTGLRITTNFTINLTENLVEKLSQFWRVEILASIDSIGDNYHYVRWPARFDKIENNLKTVALLTTQNPKKFLFQVTPVFSLNNIFYSVDYLDWWENWADQTQTELRLNTIHLYQPTHLMMENLPSQYRPILISMLEKCVDHSIFKKYKHTRVLHEYFISMLKILKNNTPDTESAFVDYLKFTADYDNRTGVDSYVLNSNLFNLLTHAHQHIYNSHLKHVQSKI
jgi:hypothetical protein